ncbi:MAG: Trk system potassium transporter TrkA [Acidimicrobiales bacterium]|nr:Trk system potassium transporter TrkA [Acidimicrobiales bacterium]
MHIIVVGAGEVGSYVADRLAREGHDVAVIETHAGRRRQIEEELDVLTIAGSGTHPAVLRQAGLDRAEILVAATSDDSANLLASMIAKQHGVPRTIVRIEAAELRGDDAAELRAASGADLIIDPDQETAIEILDLLEYPGASEVANMGADEVVVIGARLPAHSELVGKRLSEIAKQFEPEWEFIVGAITRGDKTIIPRDEDVQLETHDLLRIACRRESRRLVASLMGLARDIPRRILLLGGGRTARKLAERLSNRGAEVLILERNRGRARYLAEQLDHVLVLEGDITDNDLLDEAQVGDADAVIALTGEDDANVLACLYAKSAGAKETIAVVHRLSLLDLLDEVGVDVALSPRTASANGVMRFVRSDVAQVATFLQGDAEVLEFVVRAGSPADGQLISDLGFPRDVLLGAIVRDGKSHIARGRSRLRRNDHVVVFAMPQSVDELARWFG